MRAPLCAAVAAWLAAACAGAPAVPPASEAGLAEIRVGAAGLDPRAFVAQAAFLFPEETREIARSLLRAELAAREAERLGLAADRGRVEAEVAAFEAAVAAEIGEAGDFDAWARERYGRTWAEARLVLAAQVESNQLYQLCARAEARLAGAVRLHWLATADEAQAKAWARQLAAGADPRALAGASLVRGPLPDGSFAPAAPRLPEPHADALSGAVAGTVVGPLRFDGDRIWWVGRVAEVAQPAAGAPPVAELLQELDRAPLSPLEGRAWFEHALSRYTAAAGAPSITAPVPAFVPLR